MIRICWVTDIPTPYRNHRYERMAAIFPTLGLEVEVQFMAWTDPLRPWSYGEGDLRYPHRVHPGVNLHWIVDSFHVNPGLMARFFRDDRDVLVVGGWSFPTAIAAPFAVPRRMLRLLESESNPASSRHKTGIAGRFKAAVIDRYDGYIGPGLRSRELIVALNPRSAGRPFLEFPNLIDEKIFGAGVAEARDRREALRAEWGVGPGTALWVCPARLESYKGLDGFLPLLEGLPGMLLVVCGEGSQRRSLEEMIAARRLPVRLAGQKSEAEMVRLYAAADLFVLPSLRDASPLSPIEACAAGLPVLASRRIGNFDDVVSETSGWGFDADHPESNRALLQSIAAAPLATLAERGRHARALYERRFDSDTCVRRLGEGIRALYEKRARR